MAHSPRDGPEGPVLIQMDSKSYDVIKMVSAEDLECTPRHLLLHPYASLDTAYVTLDAPTWRVYKPEGLACRRDGITITIHLALGLGFS